MSYILLITLAFLRSLGGPEYKFYAYTGQMY